MYVLPFASCCLLAIFVFVFLRTIKTILQIEHHMDLAGSHTSHLAEEALIIKSSNDTKTNENYFLFQTSTQ